MHSHSEDDHGNECQEGCESSNAEVNSPLSVMVVQSSTSIGWQGHLGSHDRYSVQGTPWMDAMEEDDDEEMEERTQSFAGNELIVFLVLQIVVVSLPLSP